jgi:hypothetical protein
MRKFAYDVAVSAVSVLFVVVVLFAVGIAASHYRLPSYDASYDYGDDSYYGDTEGRDI